MIFVFGVMGLIIAVILVLMVRVNQRGKNQSGTAHVPPEEPPKNRASGLD